LCAAFDEQRCIVVGDISHIQETVAGSGRRLWLRQRDVVRRLQRQLETDREGLHRCPVENFVIRLISPRRLRVGLRHKRRTVSSQLEVCQRRRHRPTFVLSQASIDHRTPFVAIACIRYAQCLA